METISNAVELTEVIRQLESDKVKQGLLLKQTCIEVFLLANSINHLDKQMNHAFSFSLEDNSFGAKVVGWLSGYLIKKWITGKKGNPIQRIIGLLLQLWVTNLMTQHTGKLVLLGKFLYRLVFSKSDTDHATG